MKKKGTSDNRVWQAGNEVYVVAEPSILWGAGVIYKKDINGTGENKVLVLTWSDYRQAFLFLKIFLHVARILLLMALKK